MIEKFTKEELEQIKKELKAEPKGIQKRTLLAKEIHETVQHYKTRAEYKGIYFRELEDAIFLICDHALCNYGLNPNRGGCYRREIYIKPELGDEYYEMAKELFEIVNKHYKEKMPC